MSPVWMTPKEAMNYLKVSKATFYRMVKDGRIVAYVLTGTDEKRYRQDELDALLSPAPKGAATAETPQGTDTPIRGAERGLGDAINLKE